MISEQRLKFLNSNRKRGDVTQTLAAMAENGMVMSASNANEMLNGRFFGKYGHQFFNMLEAVIEERKKKLAEEAAKYSEDVA